MLYRKKTLSLLFILSSMLFMNALSWAETIRLKNGRIFDATIVEKNSREIKVVMRSGVVTFTPDEIDTIDGRKLTPPPVKNPAAKPAVKTAPVAPKIEPKKAQEPPAPVKKKSAKAKPVTKEVSPAPAASTTTFTNFTASTDTAPAPPARSSSRSPLSLSAVLFAVVVLVIVAVVIFFIIKRIKNRPKDPGPA